MKGLARMVVVLGLVCTVAAVGLAMIFEVTKEPIAEALRQEMLEAVDAVLPDYDNAPDAAVIAVEGTNFYPGTMKGQPVGAAFKVRTMEGYSGEIVAMVGVNPAGKVTGVRILTHTETPGLGAKFTDPAFLTQYENKSLTDANWQVKKDGGDFDQITGATITPRALVVAIGKGLEAYGKASEKIYAPAVQEQTAPVEGGSE